MENLWRLLQARRSSCFPANCIKALEVKAGSVMISLIANSLSLYFYTANWLLCGSVAEWLGRWTCDQQVASSNPGLSAIECNPGQVINTHVPLSPSSIIWYQPMGGDALRLGR